MKLKIGINEIDSFIDNLKEDSLIILSGEDKIYKTVLACSIANSLLKNKRKVLFFNLSYNRPNGKNILEDEYGYKDRKDLRIISYTLLDFEDFSDLCEENRDVDLIVIDHIYVVKKLSYKNFLNRTNISGKLKRLSKRIGVPILALDRTNINNSSSNFSFLRYLGNYRRNCDYVIDIKPNCSDERIHKVNLSIKSIKSKDIKEFELLYCKDTNCLYNINDFAYEKLNNALALGIDSIESINLCQNWQE